MIPAKTANIHYNLPRSLLRLYRRYRLSGELPYQRQVVAYWQLVSRHRYYVKTRDWLTHGNWVWLFATLIFSGIVHIMSVLIIPTIAPDTGPARLTAIAGVNEAKVLPLMTSEDMPIPFLDPNQRYAVCRYDLSSGPVSVHSPIPSEHWSVALSNYHGDNFYVISGGELLREKIELVLSMPEPVGTYLIDEGSDKGEQDGDVIQVKVTEPQGVAVVRAPIPGPAYKRITEELIGQVRCGPVSK